MRDPKPIASLTAGLLARKGNARPAMRRQPQVGGPGAVPLGHDDLGWNDMGYDVDPARRNDDDDHDLVAQRNPASGLSPMHADDVDDAGMDVADTYPINDAVAIPSQSAEPEVRRQLKALVEAVASKTTRATAPKTTTSKAASRAVAGSRGTYAFTLRLDPDRHLRLRLMSAASNCSTQQFLTAMIDDYLGQLPEMDSFVARLPATPPFTAANAKGKSR